MILNYPREEKSSKTVLLENFSEIALFFTWEQRPMEYLINIPKAYLDLCSLSPCVTLCTILSSEMC